MKVIQNKFIPFKGYKYINIFGLIFTRDKSKITDIEYNHEKIHLKQMQEMLWLPFYIWYGIEYLIVSLARLSDKQGDRYHDVSFEAAYLQFATPGQYTKWFNKIPLLGTYPIVNKQFQNYEEDKDKARKQR